jgi:cation diffusion facilitator CzcD-associated flavoprotein CzcO
MPSPLPSAQAGLAALEARLAQDLAWLELPARPWVLPVPGQAACAFDVAIVGAGMAGLTAAAALRLAGIRAVCFDRAPEGFEGPWVTTARMETLRSPKHLTGPALGLPALTFRAWYEAVHGEAAWQALDKIPRPMWMDYLRWYRRVTGVAVRNDHEIRAVQPLADGTGVELALHSAGRAWTERFPRVVLASGRDGLGGAAVPEFAAALDRRTWAHSSESFDDAWFRGRRVVVIGGSASAMDCAATALEAGAASVDLLIRRAVMPLVNKTKGAGYPGMVHGYHELPDADRWRLRRYFNQVQVPPPRGSTLRVSRHPNARFFLGAPVLAAGQAGSVAWLETPRGRFEADIVLFATGFRSEFAIRPELAAIAPAIRRWADRFAAPPDDADDELAGMPDLGPAFEFTERQPGDCPGLSRVHCFCYPALMSHGALAGDIPAISEGAQRLARGLASALLRDAFDAHLAAVQAYDDPELLGDEWRDAQRASASVDGMPVTKTGAEPSAPSSAT